MPSWPIHLALANKIKKKIKLDDEFIIGNVLPDVLQGFMVENPSVIMDKSISHFKVNNGHFRYIDFESFISKYKKNISKSLVLGYLCHLITDDYFNNYTFNKHYVVNGDKLGIILNNGSVLTDLKEKPWQIKQRDFSLYGQKLINDGVLPLVTSDKISFKIDECPVTSLDVSKTVKVINEYKNYVHRYDNSLYEMFSEEELDKLYNECYLFILDKLKTLLK